MYREQWVADILNGRTLLECALDVRMSANGSLDRSRAEQDLDIRVLEHSITNWKSTLNPKYERFDNAVKELILAALEESR